MSKKNNQNRSLKNKPSAAIAIHGIKVKLPASVTFDIAAHSQELLATTDRIVHEGRKKRPQAFSPPAPSPVTAPVSETEEQWIRTAAEIMTNAWRAKVRMINPDTNEPTDPMKRVYRYVDSIIDALKRMDVEYVDPTGKVYDSGSALKVITFEPTPGLTREEIKETIKPTITWRGRMIQMGEVIVGTPQ